MKFSLGSPAYSDSTRVRREIRISSQPLSATDCTIFWLDTSAGWWSDSRERTEVDKPSQTMSAVERSAAILAIVSFAFVLVGAVALLVMGDTRVGYLAPIGVVLFFVATQMIPEKVSADGGR